MDRYRNEISIGLDAFAEAVKAAEQIRQVVDKAYLLRSEETLSAKLVGETGEKTDESKVVVTSTRSAAGGIL